jgi:hypothetical protein
VGVRIKQRQFMVFLLPAFLAAYCIVPPVCCGQTKRTEFNGFWIGMTIAEFRLTKKGEAIVQAYAHPFDSDCVKNENDPLCEEWRKLNDATIGWDFTLSDPWDLADAAHKGSEYPETFYRFNKHKLIEITYVPGNETTNAALNQNLRFLTQRYGKPNSDSIVTKENGFGAITKERVVQWIRPDGTAISLNRELSLDSAPVVHFWIPDKPTKVTKNPF